MNGLDCFGASSLETVEEDVKVVSKRVSPWLWILSIGGFGMALMNRYQIGHMFGNFRKMKTTLWRIRSEQ